MNYVVKKPFNTVNRKLTAGDSVEAIEFESPELCEHFKTQGFIGSPDDPHDATPQSAPASSLHHDDV